MLKKRNQRVSYEYIFCLQTKTPFLKNRFFTVYESRINFTVSLIWQDWFGA